MKEVDKIALYYNLGEKKVKEIFLKLYVKMDSV